MLGTASAALACSGIDSISPNFGPTGGGTSVTITGSGFHCATVTVAFGSSPATFTVVSNEILTAVTPPGAGTVDVVVTINGTPYRLNRAFTYGPPPGTITDGDRLRSLQTGATQSAATVSGQTVSSQIEGAIANSFGGEAAPVSGGANGISFNFAAEPASRVQSKAGEAFSALAYAGNGAKFPAAKAAPTVAREWSAWLDLRGTGFETNRASADLKGSQYNVTAGIGRKLTPDLLVGIVGGYEHMQYDSAALAGGIKGDGGSAGGYLGWRMLPTVRLDAALTYGRIAYSAAAGAASGAFNGNRWVASGGLTGSHGLGQFIIEPSARLFALWEKQGAWTDSTGTAQAARNFSAGRASLGGKLIRPLTSGDLRIAPYAGLYGDYRFSSDNAVPAGTTVLVGIGDGWSARAATGLTFTTKHGASVALGGEYGGIGASYKIWSGHIRGALPF